MDMRWPSGCASIPHRAAQLFTLHRRGTQLQHTRLIGSAMGRGEEYLQSFINHEQRGVPSRAGTDTKDGFDLGRMRRLLEGMDSPHAAWPAVHVAGTKGKGSSTALLASILQAAQYRVGTYTSPHVTTLRERIAVDGQPIPEAAFDALIAAQQPALDRAREAEGGALSHFEVLTALAYRHFQDAQVDVAVVETGLGGVRDATNVFSPETLKLAVITAIGLEHQKALGGSLAEIAAAKAGIMKPGRPVVISRQPEREAMDALRKAAQTLHCPVIESAASVQLQPQGPVDLEGGMRQRVLVSMQGETSGRGVDMQLLGQHQLDNAAAAVAAALQLRDDGLGRITADSIAEGLASARMPGRFQVARLPAVADSPGEPPWLVLDGAHTSASAAALVATLGSVFPGRPLALVVGMADDKDHAGFLKELRGAGAQVVVFTSTPIAGAMHRSAAPGKLVALWQVAGMEMRRPQRCRELIQASVATAVEAARRELTASTQGGAGVVCVCGSLHAVAEALQTLALEN